MPRINPVKVKQDADRLEKAGRLDQAIALYRQIVDDNPRDWNTINKIGDLYAKLNRIREASEEYAKVAEFYARDGFLLKAIAIWKKINKLDASALEPYLNLAELYAKQGLMMEAKSQYQIVVDEHIKRGRSGDAGDVLKKMAEIDPGDLKIRSRLADLYVREGNQTMAVDEHVAIADELTKKGHLTEAVQVLDKGLKLDPGSHKLRGELARIHIIQKSFDKAAQVLEDVVRESPNETAPLFRLGEAYLGAKRTGEAEAIFKRLLEIDPQDHESRVQMGRVCLSEGQFDRAFEYFLPVVDKLIDRKEGDKAASLLQQIIQKNAEHIRSLSKLVEVYRILRKDSAAAATYSQLTEAYINLGQFEQAAGVLELLVSLEPQNQQHRTKLQFVRSKQGADAPAHAAALASSVLEVEEEDFEIPSGDESAPLIGFEDDVSAFTADAGEALPASQAAGASPSSAPSVVELSGPLSDQDKEFVDEHLAEGRVFRKYGLVDKSVDQFEAIVARFPDHVEARQELRDVYKEKGLPLKAAEQCLLLAEVHRLKGDEDSARVCEEQARALAPETPAPPAEAVEPAAPAPGAEPAPSTAAAAPAADEPDAEDISVSLDLEESGIEPPDLTAPAGEFGDLPALDLEVEGADEELPARFVEEHEPAAVHAEVPSTPPLAAAEPADLPASSEAPALLNASEEFFVSADAAPPVAAFELEADAATALAPGAGAAPPPPDAGAALPADIAKVLQEVDSYLALGFVDDAKDALREAMARHPPHEAMLAKAQELGLAEELLAEPAAAPAEAPAAVPEPEAPVAGLEPSAASEAVAPLPEEETLAIEPEAPPIELETSDAELETTAGEAEVVGDKAEIAGGVPEVLADESEAAVVEGEAQLAAPEAVVELEAPFAEPELAASEPETSAGEPEAPVGEPERPPVEETVLSVTVEEARPAPLEEQPQAPLEEPLPPLETEAPSYAESLQESSGVAAEFAASEAPGPDTVPPDPLLPESEAAHGADGGGVDLDAELGQLFAAQSAVEEPPAEVGSTDLSDVGLADIFKEFKKGVDKQLGKEDYDTRYNLGIAYKEMGLIDEAIAEFQLAAKDDNRLLECSSMLGICFMDKGMPKLAVKWFEKGLKAPGRSDEEYLGLRYDLAMAHAAAGETEKALSLFTDLYGQDANFRDVAAKVRELKAALS